MKKIIITLTAIACLMLSACGSSVGKNDKTQITVSIAPLAWIVENLTDSSVKVNVLVSPGVSPETYEPTARQIEYLRYSDIFFSIGLLDFEKQVQSRLQEIAPQTVFIQLADSLPLIEAQCSHSSHELARHEHGADPHTWLSPKMLKRMTDNVAETLITNNINSTNSIRAKRDSLFTLLDSLDCRIGIMVEQIVKTRKFAIVHPSLGYFARDYGLTQFSIETDGKEPSGHRIKALIDTLRANQISTILYSEQDPHTAAQTIASEVGGSIEKYDPMAYNLPESLTRLAEIICVKN